MDDTKRFLIWFGSQLEQVRQGLDEGRPESAETARSLLRNVAESSNDDELFSLATILLCVCDVAIERED